MAHTAISLTKEGFEKSKPSNQLLKSKTQLIAMGELACETYPIKRRSFMVSYVVSYCHGWYDRLGYCESTL